MVKFKTDNYTFFTEVGKKPENFNRWIESSVYSDLEGLGSTGTPIYICIEEADKWQTMLVCFNADIDETFFYPELFLVAETNTLFVGAGRKAMSYLLKDKVKISDRNLAMGFWSWNKHERFIVLVEELEIAVYNQFGCFIWQTRTEPPWSYGIDGNILTLDIMDVITKYQLDTGRPVD